MRIIFYLVIFSDKYGNSYRLKFLDRRYLNISDLKRLIRFKIEDLPNNHVVWSSLRVSCEFHTLKSLKSADEILQRFGI